VKKLLDFRNLIIGATVVVAAIFFVAYQQHNAAEKYKCHRAEYCASLLATAEQKKACIEEGANAHDYLPWGYELFGWPEGITTWAIIATGFVIGWQAWETRRAAEASEKSFEALKRQTDIQKASMSQWVDASFVAIRTTKITTIPNSNEIETASICLTGEIRNRTPLPLTINRIKVTISRSGIWETFTINELDEWVAPSSDSGYRFDVTFDLTQDETSLLKTRLLVLPVVVRVAFEEANHNVRMQRFPNIVKCMTHDIEILPYTDIKLRKQDDNQEKRTKQAN
jgi:hypothetical protein